MSKAVLLSIHPKWAEKIYSGKKEVEWRKTFPTEATPGMPLQDEVFGAAPPFCLWAEKSAPELAIYHDKGVRK